MDAVDLFVYLGTVGGVLIKLQCRKSGHVGSNIDPAGKLQLMAGIGCVCVCQEYGVLDACESGLGKEVKGEGVYALTTSFFYSGINNIVFSSWRAPGNAAPILMSLFYKNILDGMNYAAALRKAKLDLIKGGVFSNPFEWSPYVLVGR